MQYRTEEDEKRDRKKYCKRSRDWKRKRQVLTSLFTESEKDQEPLSTIPDGNSEQLSSKTVATSSDGLTIDSADSSQQKNSTATSELEVRDGSSKKTKRIRPTDEGGSGQTQGNASKRTSSSPKRVEKVQDNEIIFEKRRGEDELETPAGEKVVGRKTKKSSGEKETVTRRHLRSSRKNRQKMLKLKIRKTVSKARLKSYGLSV